MSNMFKRFQVTINRGNILSAMYNVDAMCVSCNQKLLGPYNKSHWRFNKSNVEQAVHMECGGYIDKLSGVNRKLMQAAKKQHPSGISVGSALVTSSFNHFEHRQRKKKSSPLSFMPVLLGKHKKTAMMR